MFRNSFAAKLAGLALLVAGSYSHGQTLKLGEVEYTRGMVGRVSDKGAGDQMVAAFQPHLGLLASDKNHGKGMKPTSLSLSTREAVRFTISAQANTAKGKTTTSSTFILVPVVGMDRSKFEAVAIRWYSQDWRQPLIVDQLAVHRPGRGVDEIAMYRGRPVWVKVQDRILAFSLAILKSNQFGKSSAAESEENRLRNTTNLFSEIQGLMSRAGNPHYAVAMGFGAANQLETAGHSDAKILECIGNNSFGTRGIGFDWREIAREIWKSIKDEAKGLLKKILKDILKDAVKIVLSWLALWL